MELEELMKLLKVNNQMDSHFYPQQNIPSRPPSQSRMGPRVIVSPAGNNTTRYDDVTDVSGMGIDRPSTRIIANEDSVNSD